MRLVEDAELSFCLTLSRGIGKSELLAILGKVEVLPVPQRFDDFAWETHQPGKKGLLNVFGDDELLVTIENNGFLGVARRTINKVKTLEGLYHYVSLYHSSSNAGYQYVEIQDGTVVANFDPLLDEAPDAVADFFPDVAHARRAMVEAAEFRMETAVIPEWLEDPTETYVIDYRIERD